MDLSFTYTPIPGERAADTYALLVLAALAGGWVFIYKLGQVLTHLVASRAGKLRELKSHELGVAVRFFAGLWAYPTLAAALGVAGVFGLPALAVVAVAILFASWRMGLGVVPRIHVALRSWWKEERSATLLGAFGALVIGAVGSSYLAAYFDGNYVVAGGHLARTGKYLAAVSDGQLGMAALGAFSTALFPKMSTVVAVAGWGPFYGPFLVLGMFFLLRELFGRGRWEALSILILAFPIAFKAYEIRGSVTGFGLAIWALVFLLRHFRTKSTVDLAAVSLILASAWNFGQLAALYLFAMLGLWSVGSWLHGLGGAKDRALSLWKALLWTNAIEWPHLALSFQWSLGAHAAAWMPFVPGTATLAMAGFMTWLVPRLPSPKLSRAWLALPFLGALVGAYLHNPHGGARYNWYFFVTRPSFEEFNFLSYGLWGILLALALVVALPDALRKKARPAASLLWLAFAVSCLFQLLAPRMLWSGKKFLFDDRAYIWDIWKDTALFWSNPLMVVGLAYLFDRLSSPGKAKGALDRLRRKVTPAKAFALVALLLLVCVQRVEPYKILLESKAEPLQKWHDVFNAHVGKHVDVAWKGQQSYSIPSYFAYAWLLGEWRLGALHQQPGCRTCTVHSYGYLREQWPVIDFMRETEILAGDSFITGDSPVTPEVYLNRQIRYSNGANTICPIYLNYLDSITGNEFYWKDGNRIRRNSKGMAYSIVDPERNLVRVKPAQAPEGGLVTKFSVPYDGDFEVYRGEEFYADKVPAFIDGQPLQPLDSPAMGWATLKAGQVYELRLGTPESGAALDPNRPVLVYSKRNWRYERWILDERDITFGATGMSRFAGLPNAPIAIDELEELLTSKDAGRRRALLAKYQARFVVLDPLLRHLYPEADALLSTDAALARHSVNGTSVFLVRSGL